MKKIKVTSNLNWKQFYEKGWYYKRSLKSCRILIRHLTGFITLMSIYCNILHWQLKESDSDTGGHAGTVSKEIQGEPHQRKLI